MNLMKIHILLVFVLVEFSITNVGCVNQPPETHYQEPIEFKEVSLDLGEVKPAIQTGSFDFSNCSDGTVGILSLKPSCSCLTVSCDCDNLKPGQAGKLEFNLDLSKQGFGPHQYEVLFEANNDTGMPVLQVLKIKSFVFRELNTLPEKLEFTVIGDEIISCSFEIVSYRKKKINFGMPSTDGKWAGDYLVSVPDSYNYGYHHKIDFKVFGKEIDLGKNNYLLRFPCSEEAGIAELKIPISVKKIPSVSIAESIEITREEEKTESHCLLSIPMRDRSGMGIEVSSVKLLTSLNIPAETEVEFKSEQIGGTYWLRCDLPGETNFREAQLKINFRSPSSCGSKTIQLLSP